jgi:molecular chaperone DnaJ
VSLKVPPESQSGRVFRLRGKGIQPARGGQQGDLFCRVVIETPVKLSTEQRELLQKFDESLRHDGNRHAPRQKSFLEGVKRFFKAAP